VITHNDQRQHGKLVTDKREVLQVWEGYIAEPNGEERTGSTQGSLGRLRVEEIELMR